MTKERKTVETFSLNKIILFFAPILLDPIKISNAMLIKTMLIFLYYIIILYHRFQDNKIPHFYVNLKKGCWNSPSMYYVVRTVVENSTSTSNPPMTSYLNKSQSWLPYPPLLYISLWNIWNVMIMCNLIVANHSSSICFPWYITLVR